jgi:hypothetical protein
MTSIINVDQIQNASGTTGLTIDSDGRVLTPVRPAFFAYANANQLTTAAATDTKVLFAAEDYDKGGDFANSEFTAPLSGLYQINVCITFISNGQSSRYVRATVFKNGSDFQIEGHSHMSNETSDSDYALVSFGAVLDLTSGDTLDVRYAVADVDVDVAGINKTTHFSGYFIG